MVLFKIRHSSIHSWLHWVSVVASGLFIAAGGLSLVVASRGYSPAVVLEFSLQWVLLSQSTGSRHLGSAVVAQRFSCPKACGNLVLNRAIELLFPALQGRFSTTEPSGKSLN